MKVRGALFALVAVLVLAIAAPASAGTGLSAYKAKARGAKQLCELKKLGFDLTEGHSEGVNGSGNRAVLMDRILDHLLQ